MSDHNKPAQTKEPEIRYVPVQFIEGYAPQSGNDEVEIDLMDILKRIWDGRKTDEGRRKMVAQNISIELAKT